MDFLIKINDQHAKKVIEALNSEITLLSQLNNDINNQCKAQFEAAMIPQPNQSLSTPAAEPTNVQPIRKRKSKK